MGYDSEENIGVDKCALSEFFTCLKGQLQLVTGLIEMPSELTLADVRRPNMVLGDPGIGKTCGIISIIDELNAQLPTDKKLGFKKILLGQTVVGSLSGIPVINNQTGEVKRVQAPDLPVAERDGEYGVLFLDEITTADEAQVQPALGLCDDTRNIGTYQLPEHWVVVAAGNGPSCANFLELHDMTLSRFVAFDVRYDYQKDWRPWAHAHGINELIIAFLNFKPEYIVHVVTSEEDKSGKQFACPRTWTRLSTELKMRELQGRRVSQNELQGFASRIIGTDAAREFAAFSMFNKTLKVDHDDILSGKVRKAEVTLQLEEFHIIIQQISKRLIKLSESTDPNDAKSVDHAYEVIGNAMRWIISTKDIMLDRTFNAISEINTEVADVGNVLADFERFSEYCPEWVDFLDEYSAALTDTENSIANIY